MEPWPLYQSGTPVNEPTVFLSKKSPNLDYNLDPKCFVDDDTITSVSEVYPQDRSNELNLSLKSTASVSTLKSMDVAKFRDGLSALDAEIAKLRLSLKS